MTLPTLSRALLASGVGPGVRVPAHALRDLPERVVQFGTGALLRGLVEPLIDDAIERGEFDGRIVMVGQTGSGRDRAINRQDGLFTLVTRGAVDGELQTQRRVVASVSRAISATDEWDAVLALARSPALRLVFSNTTEAGIALDEDDRVDGDPPRSFPGKLTRFLWERAQAFGFGRGGSLAILPTELIENNGEVLREMVLTLARRWKLGDDFERWIGDSNRFFGTLVDRIVPGTPAPDEHEKEEAVLGYRDALLTVAEPYLFFAIEGEGYLTNWLPFTGSPNVRIAAVSMYRERKLRLLNGMHTAMAPIALLSGCETVSEAVTSQMTFFLDVAMREIAPFVRAPDAEDFVVEVLERFGNPDIHHAVADITLQQTMKLRVRVVPSILAYAEGMRRAPLSLAFAMAAYLRFARGDLQREREAAGRPLPRDDQGDRVRMLWLELGDDVTALAHRACADTALWGADLSAVPGFARAVAWSLRTIMKRGTRKALIQHLGQVAGRRRNA